MSIRTLLAVCLLAVGAFAQDPYQEFVKAFDQAVEYNDGKGMDKAIKAATPQALRHYEGLCWNKKGGHDVAAKMKAFEESWARCYESADMLSSYDRWVGYLSNQDMGLVNQAQNEYVTVYNAYLKLRGDSSVGRKSWEDLRTSATTLAEKLTRLGHVISAAEAWGLVAEMSTHMPLRTIEDRHETVSALRRFLEVRRSWNWVQDTFFQQNSNFLKAEEERLEAAIADAEKRAEQGYAEGVEGVDGLVVAGVAEETFELTFKQHDLMLDADYSVNGGGVPAMWMEAQIYPKSDETKSREDGTLYSKFNWFAASDLYLVQEGINKYSLATTDINATQPIQVSSKPKPSPFFLDAAKTKPYAMWFFVGGDKEIVGTAEQNLAPTKDFTPVFYKSAASWETEIKGETVTFYDDSADGVMFESDPFAPGFKLRTLGDPKDGTVVPLLDSMRIGAKGPRIPYSEFVQIGDGWYHLHGVDGKPGIRPLNPEYFKLGKVAFKWDPKKAAPSFVVIQGTGPYAAARFDVANSKTVDVPAGDYRVIYGRIQQGKGARIQSVHIFGSEDAEPFTVEAGKTFELTMGRGLHYTFPLDVDGRKAKIDLEKLLMKDDIGCIYTQFHNVPQAPDIVFAQSADSKRMKVLESLEVMTDGTFAQQAGAKIGRIIGTYPKPKGALDGKMVVELELPAPEGAVGLAIKKHPLFPKVVPMLVPYSQD